MAHKMAVSDVLQTENELKVNNPPTTQNDVQQKSSFKKGHRRAHSMPMASHRVDNKRIAKNICGNEQQNSNVYLFFLNRIFSFCF